MSPYTFVDDMSPRDAARNADRQRAWIDRCGGSALGYVLRYGELGTQRAVDIFEADAALLTKLEQRAARARS